MKNGLIFIEAVLATEVLARGQSPKNQIGAFCQRWRITMSCPCILPKFGVSDCAQKGYLPRYRG